MRDTARDTTHQHRMGTWPTLALALALILSGCSAPSTDTEAPTGPDASSEATTEVAKPADAKKEADDGGNLIRIADDEATQDVGYSDLEGFCATEAGAALLSGIKDGGSEAEARANTLVITTLISDYHTDGTPIAATDYFDEETIAEVEHLVEDIAATSGLHGITLELHYTDQDGSGLFGVRVTPTSFEELVTDNDTDADGATVL